MKSHVVLVHACLPVWLCLWFGLCSPLSFVSAPAWGSNGGTSSGSVIGTANCIGKHVVQSVVALVLAEYHANL